MKAARPTPRLTTAIPAPVMEKMMAAGWKNEIRRLQGDRCLLCREIVDRDDRSWDHLVPQAYSGGGNNPHRIGLVFLTHRKCNSIRGHKPPTHAEISRAASIIADLDPTARNEARKNIRRVLDEQEMFVEVLENLADAVVRRLTPTPGATHG